MTPTTDFSLVSQSLILGIGSELSISHQNIAIQLLNCMQKQNLVDRNTIVDTDCADGLIVRWPSARLFCEIWDNSIHVSTLKENAKSRSDINRQSFSPDQLQQVCELITQILSGISTQMEVI